MRNSKKQIGKLGSIVLEAAVAFPMVILLLVAMLSSITVVNTDLFMRRATENVIAEVDLAIPFASNGVLCLDDVIGKLGIGELVDVDTRAVDDVLGVIGEISGATGVQLEDVLTTAVFGRYVRDRILVEYSKLVSNESLYTNLLSDVSVYLDYQSRDKTVYVNVYYDVSAGSMSISKKICSSLALYADPLSLGDKDSDPSDPSGSVWEKDNFERGTILRQKFGANLPFNFPVISYYSNREARSIKSIDTTSPYYQDLKNLDAKVKGYIRELAAFDGAKWGNTEIGPGSISSRTLVIVVPENGSEACYQELLALKAFAEQNGVKLVIEKYEVSGKYEDKSSGQALDAI